MSAPDIAEHLRDAHSLEEFYQLCEPLGLYRANGRRFLHFELDVVNRCNIRCVMCYHSLESTRRTETKYLSPADFERAASRLLPFAYHLSLSLGNEPLMSPHFVPILRASAQYSVPNVNFFTNGLLLSDASIDAIVECGVTQVCISIDGATPQTYHAIRRDGSFDRLIRNVERLIARRDASAHTTPIVRFDVVMMQRNIHELPDIVRLAARLGAQQLVFRHMVAFEGLGMESESLTRTKALSNYWLEKALETADDLGLEVQGRPAMFDLGLLDGAEPTPLASGVSTSTPFEGTPYCPFPFFHISMGPGGHVWPCPHAHGESPYGQVSEETPIDAIWLNDRFTALRARILQRDPPDMCRRCPFLADRHPNVTGLFVTRKNGDQ
jgi:MoaA/NifB/PqqE/SkfB family radical SAM enzyme